MLATIQDWEAVGHGIETHWLELAHVYGRWIALFLALLVVARALVRSRRYAAVDALGEDDLAALRAKVAAQEARTSAELAVVLVERADPHPDVPWKAAGATVVLGTLLLAGDLPWESPVLLVLAQAAIGLVGLLLAHWLPDFARTFVGEGRATEVAEEQALQEFQRLELAQLEARDAVLLFVTLFERRVVVLADEGAEEAAKAYGDPARLWIDVDAAVLEGVRAGSLRAGLERGIEAAGERLAQALPSGGDPKNRVRDDIEVRRE